MHSYLIALLLLGTILLIGAYTLLKLRRVHLMLYQAQAQSARSSKQLNDLFGQIESLLGLYVDLGLQKSLPPTRGWAASPDFLWQLTQYALNEHPKTIVECSSGVSTLVLARCMQINGSGHIYSLEHESEFACKTRQHLERHGLSEWATVLDAPLRPHQIKDETWSWYAEEVLPEGCKIDMLAIDGPPMHTRSLARYPAGPVLFSHLANNAAVFLDDAAREDEQAIMNLWCTEFPELRQTSLACEKGCAVLFKGFSV